MNRKLLSALVVGLLFSGSTVTAFAATLVTYEFTFTGQQLMGYNPTSVPSGTAADNGIYDGARHGGGYHSYLDSESSDFVNWRNTTTDRLVTFNLWGYDGKGENWGEKYKVYEWAGTATSSNPGWSSFVGTWPSAWGSFDDYADGKPGYGDHYNEGKLLTWDTWDGSDYSYANGFGFGPGEADGSFTFQMTLNMDDPAFGDTSPWHNGQEGLLVLWFGGEMMDQNGNFSALPYEGNMLVQGRLVPLPASILLFGSGLLGLFGIRVKSLYAKRG